MRGEGWRGLGWSGRQCVHVSDRMDGWSLSKMRAKLAFDINTTDLLDLVQ